LRATTLTHCKEIRKPVADKTQTGPLTVAQIVNGQIRDQIDPLKIRQGFNEAIGTEEAAAERARLPRRIDIVAEDLFRVAFRREVPFGSGSA